MRKILLTIVASLALSTTAVVRARAEVPKTEAAALSAGAATITNDAAYQVRALKAFTITAAQGSSWTATLRRIASTPIVGSTNSIVWTNQICAITSTAAQARYVETNNVWIFRSDKLQVTGAGTNTGYAVPEYSVLP